MTVKFICQKCHDKIIEQYLFREKIFLMHKEDMPGSQIINAKVIDYLSNHSREPMNVIIRHDILLIVPNSRMNRYESEELIRATFNPSVCIEKRENLTSGAMQSDLPPFEIFNAEICSTPKRKGNAIESPAKKFHVGYDPDSLDTLLNTSDISDLSPRSTVLSKGQLKQLNELIDNSRIGDTSQYRCSLCQMLVNSKAALNYHLRNSHMKRDGAKKNHLTPKKSKDSSDFSSLYDSIEFSGDENMNEIDPDDLLEPLPEDPKISQNNREAASAKPTEISENSLKAPATSNSLKRPRGTSKKLNLENPNIAKEPTSSKQHCIGM